MEQAKLIELFDYREDGRLIWKVRPSARTNAGDVAGCDSGNGYNRIKYDKTLYMTHRLVWIWHNGDIPEGLTVDHINRVRGDNRIENLRLVSRRQQNHNRGNNSKYGIGVHWKQRLKIKPYVSTIELCGKATHLGCFATPEEASLAYWKAYSYLASNTEFA